MVSISPLAKNLAYLSGTTFTGILQRSQLQVQLALGKKFDTDMAALDQKYDGKKETDLQNKVDALNKQKDAITTKATNIQNALDGMNDVRTAVADLSQFAKAGSGLTLDIELYALNQVVGSAVVNKNNLIGNPGTGVSSQPDVVTAGSASTTVKSTFLGSGYFITLNNGKVLQPDFSDGTLGSMSFDDLQLDSLSSTDGSIQFTDTSTSTSYTGTLTKTGAGIMSGWLYNNFANQSDIDNAVADIQAASQRVNQTDAAYRINLSTVKNGITQVGTQIQSATDDLNKQTLADVTAKQAAQKALQSKFDLVMNNLSLTASNATSLIQSLFLAPDPTEKQSVFGILSGVPVASPFSSTPYTSPIPASSTNPANANGSNGTSANGTSSGTGTTTGGTGSSSSSSSSGSSSSSRTNTFA